VVFQEYLHHLDEIDGRLKRLDAAIHLEATESERAPVIQALQTLRGVAEVTAGRTTMWLSPQWRENCLGSYGPLHVR
jgi:hypothetical protein